MEEASCWVTGTASVVPGWVTGTPEVDKAAVGSCGVTGAAGAETTASCWVTAGATGAVACWVTVGAGAASTRGIS